MLSPTRIEMIARIAHEAIRALCLESGYPVAEPWDNASPEERAVTLSDVNYHLNNPLVGDAARHNDWLAAMRKDKWKFGQQYSLEDKTDPAMIPYNLVDPAKRNQDRLLRYVVQGVGQV